MTLDELRAQWNGVLDSLERTDRIAWMAFFDARLAALDGTTLSLDFSDARKLGGAHEYAPVRARHLELLQQAIREVTGFSCTVVEQ